MHSNEGKEGQGSRAGCHLAKLASLPFFTTPSLPGYERFTLGSGFLAHLVKVSDSTGSWSFQTFCSLTGQCLHPWPAHCICPGRQPILLETQSHWEISEISMGHRWWQAGGKPQAALGDPVGSARCHLLPASAATGEITIFSGGASSDKQAAGGRPPQQENPLEGAASAPAVSDSRSSWNTCRQRWGGVD